MTDVPQQRREGPPRGPPENLTFMREVHDRKRPRKWLNSYIKLTIPQKNCIGTCQRPHRVVDSYDGEYEEEYTCCPPPFGMFLISIIEVAVYLYDHFTSGTLLSGPAATLFIYNPHRRAEAWRYFTYMLIHVGSNHLIVNLMVQIILGIPLEMVHRWWRVLIIYFSGVIAGSLGTSIVDPTVYLAGASGGVYALMAAHVATIIINWGEIRYAIWSLLVFLLISVLDVGSAIYSRFTSPKNQEIGYTAHLAGAIAGLLVGLYCLRNLKVLPWEKKLWWGALILYFLLMGSMILWNILDPSHFSMQYV